MTPEEMYNQQMNSGMPGQQPVPPMGEVGKTVPLQNPYMPAQPVSPYAPKTDNVQPQPQNPYDMPGAPVQMPVYGTQPQGMPNQTPMYGTMPQQVPPTYGAMPPVTYINGEDPTQKKKSKLPVIISIVASVVVLGGGGAAFGIINHNQKVKAQQEAEEAERLRLEKEEAERQAREAERQAQREAEEQARKEAEEQARREAEEAAAAEEARLAQEEAERQAQESSGRVQTFDAIAINNIFANWGYAVDTPNGYFYADEGDKCLYFQPKNGDSVVIDEGGIDGLYAYSDDSIFYNKDYEIWKANTSGQTELVFDAEESSDIWYLVAAANDIILVYKDLETDSFYISVNNDSPDTEIYDPACVSIWDGNIYYVDSVGVMYCCPVEKMGYGYEEYICTVNSPVAMVAYDNYIYWADATDDGYEIGMYDTYYAACDTLDILETTMDCTCLNVRDGVLYYGFSNSADDYCTVYSEDIETLDLNMVYEGTGLILTINMVPRSTNFLALHYDYDTEDFTTLYIDLPE